MDGNRRLNFKSKLDLVASSRFDGYRSAFLELVHPQSSWHVCDPIGDLLGPADIDAGLWQPLRQSLSGLERRDDVFIAGVFDDCEWLAATGHYFGIFSADWLGIPASGRWARLRFSEVYRLQDDRVCEAFVMFDMIDFMRQAGVDPWRQAAGIETLVPGPLTRDGVRLLPSPDRETKQTMDLLGSMLGSLFEPSKQAMGMERFWTSDMMWYGPATIGATRGLDGFFRDHQDPWMKAFPDWRDALEAPCFGDGPYACYAGWPSIRATHRGPLLGLPPTGRTVEIRVMDFWRRGGTSLAENWVLIDMPNLFRQLGVDLFAHLADTALPGNGRRAATA